jgi:methyl-accepting chemotaxis protein
MSIMEAQPTLGNGTYWRPTGRTAAHPVRLSIGVKLLAGFLALACMLAAIGVFSVAQLEVLTRANSDVSDNSLPSIRYLGAFQAASERFRATQLALVIATDAAEIAPLEADLEHQRQAATEALQGFEPLTFTPSEQQGFSSIKKKWAAYTDDNARKLLPLTRANRDADAIAYLEGDGQKLFDSIVEDLAPMIDLNLHESADTSARNRSLFADSQRLIIVGGVGAGALPVAEHRAARGGSHGSGAMPRAR